MKIIISDQADANIFLSQPTKFAAAESIAAPAGTSWRNIDAEFLR
jgi:hypothetical protein